MGVRNGSGDDEYDVTTLWLGSSGIERRSGSSETSEMETSLFPCELGASMMKCLQ